MASDCHVRCPVGWFSGSLELQSEAVRVRVPVVEVFLEGTQTKNDRTYQVNGREASTAWTDWKCSMVRCKSLGLNPRSPPTAYDLPLSHPNKPTLAAWQALIFFQVTANLSEYFKFCF